MASKIIFFFSLKTKRQNMGHKQEQEELSMTHSRRESNHDFWFWFHTIITVLAAVANVKKKKQVLRKLVCADSLKVWENSTTAIRMLTGAANTVIEWFCFLSSDTILTWMDYYFEASSTFEACLGVHLLWVENKTWGAISLCAEKRLMTAWREPWRSFNRVHTC